MIRFTFLYFLSFFLGIGTLRADMGPKPTMKFHIEMSAELSARYVRAYQLQYDNADGMGNADTLHNNMSKGPEGFFCEGPGTCRSLAYGYKPFHRLLFVFDDDTLLSPVFEKQAFNSTYKVAVNTSGIEVKNETPWFVRDVNPYAFIRAFLMTLIIELSALFILLSLFKYAPKRNFLLGVLLANCISHPIFWFGIMGIFNSGMGWFIGEFLVLAFETVFVWLFLKKSIPFGKVLAMVFILNFLSIMAGGAWLFLSLVLS